MSTSPPARIVALVIVVALLLPLGTATVAAQPSQDAGGTVVVEQGETADGIDAVSGTIIVRGTVTGDVSSAAGSVHVTETGLVEDDIDAAAGTVRIDGTIGDDVDAAGGSVEVSETGHIEGDLEVGSGHLSIDGRIDGSVTAGADTIEIGPNAEVGGEFRYDAETFDRHPDATIHGEIVRDSGLHGTTGPPNLDFLLPSWLWTGYGLLANVLLGALLLAVFPAFTSRVADRVADDPVVTGGAGLLTVVGVPVALLVFAVTIVGLPISIVGALGFAFTLWVAAVYGQYAVGAWALGNLGHDNRWLALVVGLVGFAVLGAVPLLGGLLEFAALLLGLGAIAIDLRDAYRGDGEDGAADGHQATLDETAGDAVS